MRGRAKIYREIRVHLPLRDNMRPDLAQWLIPLEAFSKHQLIVRWQWVVERVARSEVIDGHSILHEGVEFSSSYR